MRPENTVLMAVKSLRGKMSFWLPTAYRQLPAQNDSCKVDTPLTPISLTASFQSIISQLKFKQQVLL